MQIVIAFLITLLIISGCSVNKSSVQNSSLIPENIPIHKIVIAHRGASGYLPEHSIASKAMAYAMGADYIEQDVVMTKDDRLIVLHDPYLDGVTNVMQVFPTRFRNVFGKKRWLAIDFTFAEIKTLKMTEAFIIDPKTNQVSATYPERFPLFQSSFRVSTLEEEIELIQGLNKSTGKNVGIYVEVKVPWFHHYEGKDISKATLLTLKKYGYSSKKDNVYFQCFDPDETRRIKHQLMPELKMDLLLVQLIARTSWNETMRLSDGNLVPYNYDWMLEDGAMKIIAQYADAIGPDKGMIISEDSTTNQLKISNLVNDAHAHGLKVHPFTFRKDQGQIPKYASTFDELLELFLYNANVDGIFTDFPDKAAALINRLEQSEE